MRELKFRAYFVKDNYMEYFDDLYWFEENMVHNNNDTSFIIIEQFIGMNDKNGKEIYEGDIESSGSVISFGRIGYDSKLNGLTGFSLSKYEEDDNGEKFYQLEFYDNPEEIEIIGNIHENPELLT